LGLGPSTSGPADAPPSPSRIDRRLLASAALRLALLGAGLTWSVSMFVQWFSISPVSASPTLWFQWLGEHQLVAGAAIGVALFPREATRGMLRVAARPSGWLMRGLLVVSGGALAVGTPPPLAGWGAYGLGNALLGAAGAPASWGAVSPGASSGLALGLSWAFQFVLLGGFAIALAVRPEAALRSMLWTRPEMRPEDRDSTGTAGVGMDRGVGTPGSLEAVGIPERR
jgi:hypothetical protein